MNRKEAKKQLNEKKSQICVLTNQIAHLQHTVEHCLDGILGMKISYSTASESWHVSMYDTKTDETVCVCYTFASFDEVLEFIEKYKETLFDSEQYIKEM